MMNFGLEPARPWGITSLSGIEFQPKSERVNMRLPKPLLDAVKASARKAGMPYQRFIRQVLEAAVAPSAGKG
jgi:predicted DNA binding CopG/RHH family protein